MQRLIFIVLVTVFAFADAGSIGVNYGRIANNLPPPSKVVHLLKSHSIDRVKIYDADKAVLTALAGSGIKVTVDLPNEIISSAAGRGSFAVAWVQRNVARYFPATQIEAIAVGNEVFTDPNATAFLVPAMKNVHAALVRYNLHSAIKVSSPLAYSALQTSYPSSAGSFRPELVEPVIRPMLDFLRHTGSYVMVNTYPFFAYESNAGVISLDYALFRANPGVVDSGNGLPYSNLFDAQLDAVFAAMDALKYDDVAVVVSETGWPSKGDGGEVGAGVDNAAAYNGNLVRRVLTGGGTPARRKAELTVFLFALFNENQKPGPTSERNYGLFYPTEEKVYDVPLTLDALRRYRDVTPPGAGEGREKGRGNGGVSPPGTSGQTWCVAQDGAANSTLQGGLDFACGEGGADCTPIQPTKQCYEPNTLVAHASYAFNSYYQKQAHKAGSCFFGGAAVVVTQPPKFGSCVFPTGY